MVLPMTGVFIETAWIAAMDTTPDASSRLVLSRVRVLAYIVVTSLVPTLLDTTTILDMLPIGDSGTVEDVVVYITTVTSSIQLHT